MTLEKLLIFGFALAALFAITTVGTNMMSDRSDANDQYESDDHRTIWRTRASKQLIFKGRKTP